MTLEIKLAGNTECLSHWYPNAMPPKSIPQKVSKGEISPLNLLGKVTVT